LTENKSKAPNPDSKVPPKMLRLFALYENLTRFVLPLCSAIKDRPHPETPVSQSNNIVDISRVSLRQFWNLKGHMQDASTLATAHYPETLDRIFIIGAPSFFPTVWSWIKRWFDPITVSKIFILSQADMKATLEKYIAPENIPRQYGGTLDFEFGMLPVLEPAIQDALKWQDPPKLESATPSAGSVGAAVKGGVGKIIDKAKGSTDAPKEPEAKTFPIGPVKWRESRDGHLEAIAVGSEGGKRREIVLAEVQTDWTDIHGIARDNTPIDWTLEKIASTTGTSTQPTVDGDPNLGKDLADTASSGVNSPADPSPGTPVPQLPVSETEKQDIALRPANLAEKTRLAPSESQPRAGTSGTAAEQQENTHAEGHMIEGTPHVVDYGHGDKAAIVEPRTVGQARKDVSAEIPQVEPQQPTVIDQAKGAIASAVNSTSAAATAAVNTVIGKTEETPGTETEKLEEKPAKLDASDIDDRKVEAFLREESMSSKPS
jgi:hypothetical protein